MDVSIEFFMKIKSLVMCYFIWESSIEVKGLDSGPRNVPLNLAVLHPSGISMGKFLKNLWDLLSYWYTKWKKNGPLYKSCYEG
jgi:hypothetical protein